MLTLLLAIGAGIALSGTALGVRLFAQGTRGRKIPEIAIGCYFILGAGFGYLPRLLAISEATESVLLKTLLLHLAFVGFVLCPAALAVATWSTFRSGNPIAATFASLCGLASAVLLAMVLFTFSGEFGESPLAAPRLVLGISVMSWTGYEAFTHYRQGRKRVSLGLSDPLVVNRFLLWAISMAGIATLTFLRALLAAGTSAYDIALTPERMAISIGQIVAGVITIVSVALTFYPPAPYRRWLKSARLGSI